jgi:hypothetical protein
MQCQLEVIYVPGTTMNRQGTDSLSWGMWSTDLQQPLDQWQLVSAMLAPVDYLISIRWADGPTIRWAYHQW